MKISRICTRSLLALTAGFFLAAMVGNGPAWAKVCPAKANVKLKMTVGPDAGDSVSLNGVSVKLENGLCIVKTRGKQLKSKENHPSCSGAAVFSATAKNASNGKTLFNNFAAAASISSANGKCKYTLTTNFAIP